MNGDTIDDYLVPIYYNTKSPASFYGATKLWQFIKDRKDKPKDLDYEALKNWLDKQNTHAIHTTPQRNFPTEKIVVSYIDEQWDTDLIQLSDLSKYNNGYKFLMVCIDLFSRYLWVRPLKNKTGAEVTNALQDIFATGRQCDVIRSDQGREYLNTKFQDFLKENKVNHIIAYGVHKASYAERVNKTLENRLFKYFYEKQTFKYIDIIDEIVFSYNHTRHSSTGWAPADVNLKNSRQLYEHVYIPILNKRAKHPITYSFEVGDLVRLSRAATPFARGYKEHWTEELFKITRRIPSHPPRYKIKDLADEPIKGSFYEQELLKVHTENPDDIVYKIDRVIRTKTVNGQKLSLVRWYGYSEKFDTYIPTAEIKNYTGK